MAKSDRVAHNAATIKIVKKRDGSLGWRVHDENGITIKPQFGLAPGKASDREGDDAAYRASVRAIQRVLKRELARKAPLLGQSSKAMRAARLRKAMAKAGDLRKQV